MLGNKFHREANGAMFISNRPCWYVHSPLCFVRLPLPLCPFTAAAVHSIQQRSTTLHSVENFSITFFLFFFSPNTQLCAVLFLIIWSFCCCLIILIFVIFYLGPRRGKKFTTRNEWLREKNNIYFPHCFSLLFSSSLLVRAHSFTRLLTVSTFSALFFSKIYFAAKPAPLRNCTLRPYSLPSSSILPSKVMLNGTAHRLRSSSTRRPTPSSRQDNEHGHDDDDEDEGNQILNEGQPLRELSYLTDYVKEKKFHREDQRKSLSLGKSPSNIFHHPQQTTEAFSSEDEKNLSLTFLHSSPKQNEKFYHVERPNKNNDSDSIIFYDNKSHSAQHLSDVKRSLRRRMSQLGSVDEPSALATTINNTKMIDSFPSSSKSTRMHNGGGGNNKNNQINNFSAALHEHEQQQHRTSMLLRSRKNNRTSAASKSSHQSPTGNSYSATGAATYEIVPSDGDSGSSSGGSGVVDDQQPTLMELECIAGYDGGLPQYFFLEAYDSQSRKLRLNITSALNDVPLFRIDLASE